MSDILVVLDPRGAWISPHLIAVQYYFTDSDQPPAAETNQHWIGRYTATRHTIRRDLLFYGAWEPPAESTPQHWLGRHTPATHRLARHLNFGDFQPPPAETNVHWIGKYTAAIHRVRRDLLFYGAWDPLPAETNQHWLGRFKPATHTLLASSRQNPAADIFVAVAAETNPHWFGTHIQTSFNINLANIQGGDFNQAETNPNSIGRFTPATHKILASLRQYQDFQTAVVAQAETNVHWLGRFAPTAYKISISLRQHGDFQPPAAETNPNFIGRFTAQRFTLSRHLNVWKSDSDGAVQVAQPETNPHWIGNFTPYVHTINVANIQGGDFNVVETNPHWIGRYKSPSYAILISLRQNSAQDTPFDVESNFIGGFYAPEHRISRQLLFQHGWDTFTPAVQAETNPNFIGRFTAQRFTLSRHLNVWKSDSDGAFQAAQPETNPHFIGNFTPYVHTINVANIQGGDFAQAETNPNFIGRFTATKHNVARQLIHFYSAWDTAAVVVSETNPNWLGRFAPTAYKISISARQHGDFQPPAAETNLHTIGRFTPNQIRILPGLRQSPASDFVTAAPQVETNPNFLGKFTPNQIRILPGLRQNPATDFIVGPVVPPTAGAGGERWPRYSWRWCDFTDREWFKAFCEEFYRLKALKNPELRRQQLADLEQALDLAIERASGGTGEPEWIFDIRTAGGMLQEEAGSPDVFDRIEAGLMRLALEADDEEAFLLLGS